MNLSKKLFPLLLTLPLVRVAYSNSGVCGVCDASDHKKNEKDKNIVSATNLTIKARNQNCLNTNKLPEKTGGSKKRTP